MGSSTKAGADLGAGAGAAGVGDVADLDSGIDLGAGVGAAGVGDKTDVDGTDTGLGVGTAGVGLTLRVPVVTSADDDDADDDERSVAFNDIGSGGSLVDRFKLRFVDCAMTAL